MIDFADFSAVTDRCRNLLTDLRIDDDRSDGRPTVPLEQLASMIEYFELILTDTKLRGRGATSALRGI